MIYMFLLYFSSFHFHCQLVKDQLQRKYGGRFKPPLPHPPLFSTDLLLEYANVFPIKNKFQLVILAFYFDLVSPFYFLKCNRSFLIFIPVLSESFHYFNYLLSREVYIIYKLKEFR